LIPSTGERSEVLVEELSSAGTERGLDLYSLANGFGCLESLSPDPEGGSEVYLCWGDNALGQLGDGEGPTRQATPGPLTSSPEAEAPFVPWIGFDHGCGMSAGGVLCWGRGDSGELGDGSLTAAAPTPVLVLDESGEAPLGARSGGGFERVGEAALGAHHTCMPIGSEIYCWGDNESGALGDGSFTRSALPVRVRAQTE
jgi:hypothetical protein